MATPLTSNVEQALKNSAMIFYNALCARTRTGYPHTKRSGYQTVYSIEDATRISSPVSNGGRIYIDIIINLKLAPYAAAYEFGHPEEYWIKPVHGKALALPFGRWNPTDRVVVGKQGYLLWKALHPPIKEKPFLRPTIKETRKEIAQTIGREFIASLHFGGKIIIT